MLKRPIGARIELEEIPFKDFTYFETGVSPMGIRYDDYTQAVHQACQQKTATNLGINYDPELNLICTDCVHHTAMPGIYLYEDGRCNMCHTYEINIKRSHENGVLEQQFAEFQQASNPDAKCDVVLGLSGGKDSSALLDYLVHDCKLRVKAVLVENGYIPEDVIKNCREMCEKVGVEFVLYSIKLNIETNQVGENELLKDYPCAHCAKGFKSLIVDFTVSQNCNKIAMGRNFWSTLEPEVSAISERKASNGETVKIFYLPFILGWTKKDQGPRLDRIRWNYNNQNIEGLSTNCLIPGLVEDRYMSNTGINPETLLLGNEVIVGFDSRENALKELNLTNLSTYKK